MAEKNIRSALQLKKLVFDKIEFNRHGFQNQNKPEFKIQSEISKREDDEVYRCSLTLKGNKRDEYTLEVKLSGYFTFSSEEEITEKRKNEVITKNTIAIIMPYLRSEITLLTSQPDTEPVILPVLNINNMMENDQ